ncbi:ABC transporter substrate-binding protein [Azospirillum sp. B510]|uniref:ABC transporter substrate-binding protein n=1 Tax=Azospirillum sp. (strain B510) TaxID=137722 RepID=UPI00030FA583|nr:ABC transporter substrate-binding protein [Azospirillum sp. B510]
MPTPFRHSVIAASRAALGVVLAAVLFTAVQAPTSVRAAELVDVLGRPVTVPDHVERVVLGEGRLFYAMAVLDRDAPFKRIAGWQNDLRKLDAKTFDGYVAQYPEAARIPLIGETSEQSVSVERILALKPDLAVFSISGHGPTEHSPVADVLAQAGVPVVFVDFRVHPIDGTRQSFTALGKALGREAEATAYLDFYNRHLARITDAVSSLPDSARPKVMLELLAGAWQSPGHTTGGGGMGEVIAAVGGRNIAAGVVPGAIGDISVEYALTADPDVYIATGSRNPGVLLGAQATPEEAAKSFAKVLARPEFAGLRAIRDGRAHALWHEFYNSPYNIVAIEALATWIHPEKFAEVKPQQTLQELYDRFLPFKRSGTYLVDEAPKS